MTGDREAFEAAIRADPYDMVLRKVFSDWLEEHGFDDEAVEQRSWTREKTGAVEWLRRYAAQIMSDQGHSSDDPSSTDEPVSMTYEELIAAANAFLDRGKYHVLRGVNTPDVVYDERREFWKQFTLATGREVARVKRDVTFISCGC